MCGKPSLTISLTDSTITHCVGLGCYLIIDERCFGGGHLSDIVFDEEAVASIAPLNGTFDDVFHKSFQARYQSTDGLWEDRGSLSQYELLSVLVATQRS